ncbi:MAG: anti-sigma factor [Chthoniobacterales bacterium]
MIDENLQTDAALYALGALTDEEAATFRAQLAGNPELAALVAEYEAATTGVIAPSAPVVFPPAHLREKILAAVAPKPSVVESSRMAWLPWALAAGFAFAAGVLWMQNDQLRVENRGHLAEWTRLNEDLQAANMDRSQKGKVLFDLEKQTAGLRKTIADLEKRNEIAEMQVATLTSKLDTSYLASIAWDKNAQEGILHVRRLPAAERGKDYQLWVIDPKYKIPVSAGIFKVESDGSATIRFAPEQRISQAAAFAVSVEKSGGSTAPEGPIVLSN